MRNNENVLKVNGSIFLGMDELFNEEDLCETNEFLMSICYDTENQLTKNELPLIEKVLMKSSLVKELKELLVDCYEAILNFGTIKLEKMETYL